MKRGSKKKEEKAIFYDIFIKPKEMKIREIAMKRQEQKLLKEQENNKKIDHNDPKTVQLKKEKRIKSYFTKKISGILSNKTGTNMDNTSRSNRSFVSGKDPNSLQELIDYLKEKFIPTINSANRLNFFNQLIQIKPPEGINAIVASPLMEGNKYILP